MAISDLVTAMKADFKLEYTYLSVEEIERLYQKALGFYCDIAYPFDYTIVAIPETRPRAVKWVRDCMVEILERNGCSSVVAYSENGMSMDFGVSEISAGLRSRLVPCVGNVESEVVV